MKFIRLTSVFLCCALLSSFLILPASAVDDDNYYFAPPVSSSEPSLAFDWPVSSVAEYDSILGTISRQLGAISTQISDVLKNQVTTAQILSGISGILTNNGKSLSRIESSLGSFATESTLSALSDKVATESTLSKVSKYFTDGYVAWYPLDADGNPNLNSEYGFATGSFGQFMSTYMFNMTIDGFIKNQGYTVYHYLKNLSDVLAPEDDKKLAQSQKENREQIENDFLNGSSGKTSLGKDDFGSLSSVGGTFKDTISLNGQSSLSDLTSGLADADTAGQGWFSQATKDSLDTVSGSGSSESTVSTFSDDGLSSVDLDPDPYHMQGFEDNYAWLWGDD